MDDLISRQAAIGHAISGLTREYEGEKWIRVSEVRESLKTMPSAQRWIPVSERLPKNDDWVIVTILDESGDTPWRYTDFGWYLEEANCWVVEAEQRRDIVAWMPLPKPYKEEKDEQT